MTQDEEEILARGNAGLNRIFEGAGAALDQLQAAPPKPPRKKRSDAGTHRPAAPPPPPPPVPPPVAQKGISEERVKRLASFLVLEGMYEAAEHVIDMICEAKRCEISG